MITIRSYVPQAVDLTVRTLRAGGLVVFPTETVYGLAADPRDERALRRVFALKGRSVLKTIPVMVNSAAQIAEVAATWPAEAEMLAHALWPGPLTIVVPRRVSFPDLIHGDKTVGLRRPDHPFVQAVLDLTGPLAVTSANLSGLPAAKTAEEARRYFHAQIDLLVDGGEVPSGVASTVIEIIGGHCHIIRQGEITAAQVEAVLKPG